MTDNIDTTTLPQTKLKFTSLDEMLSMHSGEISPDFQELLIANPDRAQRMYDAAERGADGSTHRDHIEDWRYFLNSLDVFDPEFDDIEEIGFFDITEEIEKNVSMAIDSCEDWHIQNGSIDSQVG